MPFSTHFIPDPRITETTGRQWLTVNAGQVQQVIVDLWYLDARFGNISAQFITNKATTAKIFYSNLYDIPVVKDVYPSGVWIDSGKTITTEAKKVSHTAIELPVCRWVMFEFDNTADADELQIIGAIVGA